MFIISNVIVFDVMKV